MSQRRRVNRKKYNQRSRMPMKDGLGNRACVYWREMNGGNLDCVWMDYQFIATDWNSICSFVWSVREQNQLKLEEETKCQVKNV